MQSVWGKGPHNADPSGTEGIARMYAEANRCSCIQEDYLADKDAEQSDEGDMVHVYCLLPYRLDDDRGSFFWSVKYKFGGAYWLPPTAGGKDMCPNRLPGWADPNDPLYSSQWGWAQSTLSWCSHMSPSSGAGPSYDLSLGELAAFVEEQTVAQKLNPKWIARQLRDSPCFLLNTRDDLTNSCGFLHRAQEVKTNSPGDMAAHRKVFDSYHNIEYRSVDPSDVDTQRVCHDEVMGFCSELCAAPAVQFGEGACTTICRALATFGPA
jgi:hypothetical protein